MAWFALHSVLMLSLAFVVGLGVGWLIWARQWTPVDGPEAASPPPVETAPLLPALPVELTDVHPREPADLLDRYWQPQVVASGPVVMPDGGFSVDDGVTEALPVLTDSAMQSLPLQAGSVDTMPVETMPIPITADFLPSPAADAGAQAEFEAEFTAEADFEADFEAEVEAEPEAETGSDQDDAGPPLSEATDSPDSIHPTDSEEVDVNEADPSEVDLSEADTSDPALIDDLTRIDGVTEAMAIALAAEGLGSFFAVANAPEDHLRRALRVNRIRSAPGIAFWSARAAELAEEATAQRAATPPQGLAADEPDVALDPPPAEPPSDPDAEHEPEPAGPADTTEPTQPIAMPATRTGPGAAFRTVAHNSGPSWTTVGPVAEDDLERIVGIGAAVAASLREAGVANYTQLAAVRDEELRSILTDAGLSLPPTLGTWSVQAALLLQGDADGAATLAGGLMVGREGA